jgi:hypothetical protein
LLRHYNGVTSWEGSRGHHTV